MLNESLICCVQRYVEGKSHSINNLTALYDSVKPCFPENASFSAVVFYLMNVDEDSNRCSKLQNENTYCNVNTKNSKIALTVFLVAIMIVAVFGNLIVCVVIYNTLSLRRVFTNRFIISLAVSDLMVAILLVPVKIDSALNNGSLCKSRALCHYYVTFDNISFVASITNLLVITADRLIAIVKPYRYQEIVTHKRARLMIIIVWLYAIAIGGFTNINWGDSVSDDKNRQLCWNQNKAYVTVVFIAVFFLPSLIMGVAHAKMLCIALKHSRSIASDSKLKDSFKESFEEEDSSIQHHKHVILRLKRVLKEYRPVKFVMVVYGTFVFCWLPVSVISLVHSWCKNCVQLTDWQIAVFVEFFPVLNSTFNFFIYSFMNGKFRKACKRFFVSSWQNIVSKSQSRSY